MDYLLQIIIIGLFVFSDAFDSTENMCNVGQYQSPVNVDDTYLKFYYVPTIELYNYQLTYIVPLINTGTTVRLNFDGQSDVPFISNGILDSSEYILSQIHFHWQAEHTINRRRFPLEGHFVHYLKEAGNFSNALKIENGVVVLGVFYEYQNFHSGATSGFSEIVKNMELISQQPDDPVYIYFKPDNLLPKDLSTFFFYKGSLTTSNCPEGIQWIIFDELGHIDPLEHKILTDIYSNDSLLVDHNFRMLQPLNDREIYYSPGILKERTSFDDVERTWY